MMKSFTEITKYETTLNCFSSDKKGAGGLLRPKLSKKRVLRESLLPKDSLAFYHGEKLHNKNKLLFVIIYENHIKQFKPIANSLKKLNYKFNVIYIQKEIYNKYKNLHRNQVLINAYYSLGHYYLLIIKQWIFCLKLILKYLFKKDNTISINNMLQTVFYYFMECNMMKYAFDKILQRFNGKVVLFKAEGYIANTIINQCKVYKIKSYAIQHGLINTHHIFNDINVDHYLVWSEYFAKILLEKNRQLSVISTGCASLDEQFKIKNKNNHNINPKTKLNILILPASGDSHTTKTQIYLLIDLCFEYANKYKNTMITVKPHPADRRNNVINYIQCKYQITKNIKLKNRYEKVEFIKHDFVVMNNSGVGIEACIWNKPIIIVSDKRENVHVPFYLKELVAEFANNNHRFEVAIDKIINDFDSFKIRSNKFLNKYFVNQGIAIDKILNVIK